MKNGKKPSLRQKKVIRSHGLDPGKWLVVKDLGNQIEVVSRIALKKTGSKPKTRTLVVE